MGTDCKSAAFSFGGSNPPAPTKKSSIRTGYWIFYFADIFSGLGGWIRTTAALSQKTAQKQPSGLFLAARLAQSTRAHQKASTYVSALRFLFCNKAKLIERVDSNSIDLPNSPAGKKAPVQQRRPLPAAETGRSCWGCGQQDARAAQGTVQPLGAATRAPYTARLATSALTHIASVSDL